MRLITVDNLIRHELLGLEIRVNGSTNKNQNKLSGIIVNETKNTFVIYRNRKEKILSKNESNLIFNLDGNLVEINGKTLIGRPEDRVKKKSKRNW
jgi:ribonuclease P protein subunit POP4